MIHDATVTLTDSARRAYRASATTQYVYDRVLWTQEGRVLRNLGKGRLEVEFSVWGLPFRMEVSESEIVWQEVEGMVAA